MSPLIRSAWTVLAVVLSALVPCGADEPQQSQPNTAFSHSDLKWWPDSDGRRRPLQTREHWARRRAAILKGFQEAAGPLPDLSKLPPLSVEHHNSQAGDGYTRWEVSYQADHDGRVTAHLYLPTAERPGQRCAAVLALHPTGAPGKGIVAGESGRANRQYAAELAQRGYVVLAPDYPSFGDLADYDFATDHYESGTMKGIVNHIRGVDLLVNRPEVDPKRIGVIGHSLGGHNAIFLGVFDPRVQVIVSSCGWTPFHDYYGGRIVGWTSDRYLPRLKTAYELNPDKVPFDFYELTAALAPRWFLSCSPVGDANFDVVGVRKAEPKVREIYKLHSAAERFRVLYPECEHDFPPETREAAYRFIDRALNGR